MTKAVKSNPTQKSTKSSYIRKVVSTKIQGGGDVDTSRFKYNQSPAETPDGVIVIFTIPNGDNFISGLIEVFLNGNQKIKDVEWQENGANKITFIGSYAITPPASDETIKFNYIKQ